MLFPEKKQLSELINACADTQTDCVLICPSYPCMSDYAALALTMSKPLLVLTAGETYPFSCEADGCFFLTGEYEKPYEAVLSCKSGVVVTPVGRLSDESMWYFFNTGYFSAAVFESAECALAYEYGYKGAYAIFADVRAAARKFVPAVVITDSYSADKVTDIASVLSFANSCVINAGERKCACDYRLFDSVRQRYSYLADEAEISAVKNTLVLFSTRRELSEFARYLSKRTGNFVCFHSGMEKMQLKRATSDFLYRRTGILLATKSILPSKPFLSADRVFYCGLPYSQSHMSRCCAMSANNSIIICCTPSDIAQNERVIASRCAVFDPRNETGILKKSCNAFDVIVKTSGLK